MSDIFKCFVAQANTTTSHTHRKQVFRIRTRHTFAQKGRKRIVIALYSRRPVLFLCVFGFMCVSFEFSTTTTRTHDYSSLHDLTSNQVFFAHSKCIRTHTKREAFLRKEIKFTASNKRSDATHYAM